MDDEYAENAVRLLDIVYGLYGTDKQYPYENLPFVLNENGVLDINSDLMAELNKDENKDLIDWAHKNIASLFE